MTAASATHLLWLPNFQMFIPAVKMKNGWRFSNGTLAALWLMG